MTLELAHVTFDCADPQRVAGFWAAALGRPADPGGNRYFVFIGPDPSTPGGAAWFFIWVPEAKSTKNRLHVDLRASDRQGEVARLQLLGASLGAQHDEHGARWTVMSDVEGNEFCVGER
ncbi:MAG: VOC family protein [Actinomycetota bacterium]|nr:VOC family protein [Actinomycetota bacterium]